MKMTLSQEEIVVAATLYCKRILGNPPEIEVECTNDYYAHALDFNITLAKPGGSAATVLTVPEADHDPA